MENFQSRIFLRFGFEIMSMTSLINVFKRWMDKALNIYPSFLYNKAYAVVWIPLIHHDKNFLDHPLKKTLEYQISDYGSNCRLKITVNENHDIVISMKEYGEASQYSDIGILHFEQVAENGLVKYSFQDIEVRNNGFIIRPGQPFPSVLSGMIISLYHQHEFHNYEKAPGNEYPDEPLLPTYVNIKDTDICSKDNEAIYHYLNSFYISLSRIIENARDLLEYERNTNKEEDKIRTYSSFPKLYSTVLGYHAYINSLYHSKYNVSIHLNSDKSKLKILAFNIKNSVDYFKALNEYFQTKITATNVNNILALSAENLAQAQKSERKANIKANLSIWLAIVSIALSVFLSIWSTKESGKATKSVQDSADKLERLIDSIGNKQNNVLDQINTITLSDHLPPPDTIRSSRSSKP